MNYDLTRQAYGKIEMNIDNSMSYGDVPSTMLMEKFEETDTNGNEELAYDSYVRSEITNWGPDRNLFEHERPRGAVNRSYGLIQLRSDGHRGTADVERPEIFLGFGGPEDRDPRGINVEPDMKELVRQEQARMRFIRFTPDHSDQVTGGMRSEAKVMADNQTLFKIKRDRLKIFSRQIDGRREGLRRVYAHKSDLAKQVLVQSYGDFIKDYAMNPQRRANIISRGIIRDSAKWRSETSDQDYQIARYSQICRRAKSTTAHKRVRDAKASDDTKWSDTDNSKNYRALGLLMSHMIRGKRTRCQDNGDIDMYNSEKTQDRKNTPVAKDIALILRAMTQDAEFSGSDTTMTVKTKSQGPQAVLARQIVYNHIAPAHHHLNAEIIYKQVRPGSDRKCKDKVITDARQVDITSTETIFGKRASRGTKTGRKLSTTNDDRPGESSDTVNYKTLISEKKSVRTNTNGEDVGGESDDTQVRRELNKNHRNVSKNDYETGIDFLDNTSKERLGGRMGSKYTMRLHERDGKTSNLGE